MANFTFPVRPKNRRLSLLVMTLGCTAALIALDKFAETDKRLAAARQQVAAISRDVPAQPSKPDEATDKKNALARAIQTSMAIDWNSRLNLLESLRGEAVWVGLIKLTAADTKAELRLMSDTLEAANGALDRYAQAAGEDMRPTVTSIAYRDRRYVTTTIVPVR
ncbi:signal peptide protein [Ralstonia sp. A12]|uniref:hypothetical protein n=1 Tax=Ralstonia sp. A12 TaxID=1217052 RepID=UPI000575CC83|nr:hypothetical protein [Ralstonia sp. A12]KHK54118.1 signal peptide protein [Ralstonia sp. A12]